jgi:diguanylate cyclase (GGDEF)-like protein/PAS domain S-box-containing protein
MAMNDPEMTTTTSLTALPPVELLWARNLRGHLTLADSTKTGFFPNCWSAAEFLDHLHPEDRESVEVLVREIGSGKPLPEIEYRLRLNTGEYRWISERNLPRETENGSGQFISAAFDITLLKEASDRLEASKQRFQDIADVAGDWFWEMDVDLRICYLSGRFFNLFDIPAERVIGKRRDEFAGAQSTDPKWRQHLSDLAARRLIHEFRYEALLPSGQVKHFEINGKPVFDHAGTFRGYRGTGTDRTAEIEARLAMQRGEQQYRYLVEGSVQGLLIHSDWKILFANQALADMFGFENVDEIMEMESLETFVHPEERERLRQYKVARERGDDAPEVYQARCVRKDGTVIWAEIRATRIEWQGEPALQTTLIEVTDRKKAEEAQRIQHEKLVEQNERFNIALENMSQGLCMFDGEERLVVCNRRYSDMYQLPHELVVPGTALRKILEYRVKQGIYGREDPRGYVEERLAAARSSEAFTKIQEMTDGRVVAIAHRPMANGGWVATHEDITELQKVQERIAHMALHDALTDLPNRALLRERIEDALPRAEAGKAFAILCLDLDRFKIVNDTLGHAAGDELLKEVADRLLQCVSDEDTIARLGGDEFAIVQMDENQPKAATRLASRICEVIKRPFELQGHEGVVDTSIGIAIAPYDGLDADLLLRNADLALYKAKNDGRGGHHFFEAGMDAIMQARRGLELDLRKALEFGEFELFYQPIVNLQTDELAGFEALIRWNHPERGMIPPAQFIPIAEEIGLIVPLGEWVLKTACAQAALWPDHIKVAINLSPVQFRSTNLVAAVFNALANSGIAAGRLELEITETVLLANTIATLEILHKMRDMGVRIVMDDFGTGYSSLSYLRSFPFDKIKIDRSFVSDLSQGNNSAIVDAVANLCRSLGMTTTAEGVETKEQLAMVKSAGYTEMQGFLFSPPRPAADIEKLYFPLAANAAGPTAAGGHFIEMKRSS